VAKRKVVVTGASGYVAGRMLDDLRARYDLVLLDVKTTHRDGHEVEDIRVADLLNRDRDAYRAHFSGADAVVHCGFTRAARPEDRFFAEHDNVKMAYNVYQTCVEEGVRRAVVISSNHAADYYERLIWSDRLEYVTPAMAPLSDNFYGWAKATYEHLGFLFATGRLGRAVETVQVRVGAPRPIRAADFGGDETSYKRDLGAYISERDMRQLYTKSIEAEDIRNQAGIPFQIFYGISNNTRAFWSIANARAVIGYAPADDSEIEFADEVRRHITTNGRTM